jgi:hypothetical protein
MQRSTSERGFAVTTYLEYDRSYIRAQCEFRLVLLFQVGKPLLLGLTMGQTTLRRGGSARAFRTPKNVGPIWVAIARSPQRSVGRHSIALGLSTRTVRRILHDDLHLHPYKMQMVHALNPRDYAMRVGFCEYILQLLDDCPQLIDNLWMSDKTHFHLSGYVNKHNFHYWATASPFGQSYSLVCDLFEWSNWSIFFQEWWWPCSYSYISALRSYAEKLPHSRTSQISCAWEHSFPTRWSH